VRVAELDPEERPREKLLERGPAALTDVELLAILLRTGVRGTPVLEFARGWLAETGGLDRLVSADVGQLLRRKGIGAAKAAAVAAALEIGRRIARERLEGRPVLDRPDLVADFLRRVHGRERVELFGCLLLDARNRLLRTLTLHRGGRAQAAVEPAEVFYPAIRDNCHALVLWHTHPSGDCTPSEDDIALTRRLAEAGRLLSIAVLDHLVIGRDGFVSLRQRGVLPLG
jgi:DNA repair protein RadC